MNAPGHEMILASAGSGKTYQLTHRYVRLLALGAAPERIVALTFTRKAAGEFFDAILRKLAAAAADPAVAAQLGAETGAPLRRPEEFGALLRRVIDAMPQLALGTLDAFFGRIVRAFPLELGLAGDFEILQEHSARVERQRVLRRMFAGTGREPDAAQREFIEAFKRATFGTEEKRLAPRLDRFLDRYQNVFLAAPAREAWGDPARIWPGGCPWLGAGEPPTAAERLRALLALRHDLADKQRARWDAFFAHLPQWSPGAPLPKPVEYILKNTLDVWEEVLAGDAEVVIERQRVPLASDECRALALIVCGIVGAEFTRHLEMTRGIHAVLHGYEFVYHDLVRRAGRLTFADITRLLGGFDGDLGAGNTVAGTDAGARRLLLDWRLDGRYDHWLLDEFQDTSHAQWSVLRNLIDEVVQDDSQRRTFFYVGDVKQAIYGWREGDPRLFREIFDHYNRRRPGAIAERRLDQSFRSAPPILELVNRLFRDAAVLARFSPPAAERWAREWGEHSSARPALTGQAAWLHADDEAGRFAIVLRLLREIRPLERGLSVGILTQTNDIAARLADHLRGSGALPAVAEADQHIATDNPVGAALLALFQAAAHPGDTLAWEHVRMTPWRAVLEQAAITSRDALTRRLLDDVHTAGFAATVEAWLRRLEPHLAADDRFSRERGAQLSEAARAFDTAGGREVAEFLQFMERHVVRDAESAGVVRVMTIHKAKGLGFDLVIVPDLEGSRLAARRDGLAVRKNPDRSVAWVFDLPAKVFRERDPVLAAHVADEEVDACYEEFAKLYVATTRAKRGLYLVTEPAGRSSSLNFPRLLTATLGGDATEVAVGAERFTGGFVCGASDWFAGLAATAPPVHDAGIVPLSETNRARLRRRVALTPSRLRRGTVSGAALFSAGAGGGEIFGTAVHAALAAVEWWDDARAVAWAGEMRAAGTPSDASTAAKACLDAPALAEIFRAPPGDSGGRGEVWRERAFEIVLDDAWISGVFDRVIVARDAAERVRAVRVYDFKTDRVGASPEDWRRAAERYAPQLALYRRAAAMLAGVPQANVTCAIVLTGARDAGGSVPGPIAV